jgi:hypothetical protein
MGVKRMGPGWDFAEQKMVRARQLPPPNPPPLEVRSTAF